MARIIGAIPMVLDYREHDRWWPPSAICPIDRLLLVNLVRDSDTPAGTMKQVAAGGFRISPASPPPPQSVGADLYDQHVPNRGGSGALHRLPCQVLEQIRGGTTGPSTKLFETSRDYRNSITSGLGALDPPTSSRWTWWTEVGSISTISVILTAAKGISIKNIGINNNREHGEGALKIASTTRSFHGGGLEDLDKYKYEMFRV